MQRANAMMSLAPLAASLAFLCLAPLAAQQQEQQLQMA
jgi:hypothetical protein